MSIRRETLKCVGQKSQHHEHQRGDFETHVAASALFMSIRRETASLLCSESAVHEQRIVSP